MPAIKDPDKETSRVAAVRAALQRDQRWLRGAFFGNISPEGRRRRGQNAVKHGGFALGLVVAYAHAVQRALKIESPPRS